MAQAITEAIKSHIVQRFELKNKVIFLFYTQHLHTSISNTSIIRIKSK